MKTSTIVKVVVIVVGFGAAGIIFAMTTGGEKREESTPESVQQMVDLVCVESGKHFQRPFDEIREFGMKPRGGRGRATQDPAAGSVVVYPIAECGDAGAVLAGYCDACDKYYAKFMPDGKTGVCPECGK